MSKHTPGPWERSGPYEDDYGDMWIYVAMANTDPHKTLIATVLIGEDGEGLEDARLIAAAPELLEALESIANLPALSLMPPVTALDWCRKVARDAIRKATGGDDE